MLHILIGYGKVPRRLLHCVGAPGPRRAYAAVPGPSRPHQAGEEGQIATMTERSRQRPREHTLASHPTDASAPPPERVQALTIDQLGWTPEEAAAIRASLSAFAADWDHPSMAIYDGL